MFSNCVRSAPFPFLLGRVFIEAITDTSHTLRPSFPFLFRGAFIEVLAQAVPSPIPLFHFPSYLERLSLRP